MLILGLVLINTKNTLFWVTIFLLGILMIHNLIVLLPFTPVYRKRNNKEIPKDSETISLISANVYQFNKHYNLLINLVQEVKPDILLTMESNQAWEDALAEIETDYPNYKKVALENTYGMHFYTNLKVTSLKVNYFVADDVPSIEASLITDSGIPFTFFGVHPPPPSPTEEDTSKERDGELLSLGKRVLETKGAKVVVGDFNNVAWAKASILFRKTSKLLDPRIGRGFVSTYHAKYKLLRFPIDLSFHSPDILIKDFKALKYIGSDHLPLFCSFHISKKDENKEEVETLDREEAEEVDEMIEDGKKEEGERPDVAQE
ncbi:endonuclease [Bizionia arctica]|uniref:Endonuclease n=2 Tax=Bizionia arctica TaxID=1495645 RepID=A0A917GHX2_9FLAO|nr:endonuclease [Bizionia arctica]